MSRIVRAAAVALPFGGLLAGRPDTALGHVAEGPALPPLDLAQALGAWAFDPLVWVAAGLAAIGYLIAARRVDRAHPHSRVPRRRLAAWLGGLAVVFVALQSSIDVYATTLFSVHMVQHLLLTMVAAPLLVLGAPITLLLRVAPARTRQAWILPVLHSRLVRVLSHPVVAWTAFAVVMWVTHFSPLFGASLADALVHSGEHALFLGAALLFWWPAIGADPAPSRLGPAARVGYLALGMPQSSFLGLALFSAPRVLYEHYTEVASGGAAGALADQQLAGGLMWAGGDGLFLLALVLGVAAWLRAEDEKGVRLNARLDREQAALERRAAAGLPRLDGEPQG